MNRILFPRGKKTSYVTAVILLCILTFFLFFSASWVEGFSEQQVGCVVVIYENSTKPTRTQNMVKLLQHFHYPYRIVGTGDDWNSWYGRFTKYLETLETIDDDTYVLLSDGRDVLPNEEYSVFLKKAVNMCSRKGGAVVFNSEKHCCNVGKEFEGSSEERKIYVDELKAYFEKISPDDTPHKYLNFGMIFGKCHDIKEMFYLMNMMPEYDDQGLITQMIKEQKFTHYYLDYYNELFVAMFAEPKWDEDRRGFVVPENQAFPSFFHFPGKTQWYESCARKMMKEHLSEDPFL